MTLGDRLVVMDNGYAAQIGSPLEVYERPANMFVAGFIGSPAMNFMEVTVQEGGQALKLPGGLQIPLNGSALPGWAGKSAILGIRPEHMELDSKVPPTILVTVGQVELLGADTLVHGHIGDEKVSLTVRLPDVHRFEKHATIRLSISQEKLHLFDPETKKRLD